MRRVFILVAAVVLVDTAFYAAIVPLLPHYEDELGISQTAAGVLTASYAAGTLVASLPGGLLAARIGVKPTLLSGLALLAGTSLVFGHATDAAVLDMTRFLQGVGGALADSVGDAFAYCALVGLCAVTLAAQLQRGVPAPAPSSASAS
jgi:MFS family permease